MAWPLRRSISLILLDKVKLNDDIFFPEWISNPISIVIETPDYPVENIPFPTVTVCPDENYFNPLGFISKLLDFSKFPPVYE